MNKIEKHYNEIILGTTKQRAIEKLQTIELDKDEVVIARCKDVIKTNKRTIRAEEGRLGCRGLRCLYAHVDIEFSIKFLHEVVYPIVMSSSYFGIKETTRERIYFFGWEY